MTNKSFFDQLASLCSNVERGVESLSKEYEIAPGSCPERYDNGMDEFKEHFNELKADFTKLDDGVGELDKFSIFCDSLNEMIKEYKEDVWVWEEELRRYGYKPPTDESKLFAEEMKKTPEFEKEEIGDSVPESEAPTVILPTVQNIKQYQSPQVKALPDHLSSRVLFSVQQTPASVARRAQFDKWLRPDVNSQPDEDDCVTPFVLSRKSKSREPETVQKSVRFAVPKETPLNDSLEVSSFAKMMSDLPSSPVQTSDDSPTSESLPDMVSSCKTREDTPEEPTMSAVSRHTLKASRKHVINPKTLDTILCNRKNSDEFSDGVPTPVTPKSPGMSDTTVQFLHEIELMKSRPMPLQKMQMSSNCDSEKENIPSSYQ